MKTSCSSINSRKSFAKNWILFVVLAFSVLLWGCKRQQPTSLRTPEESWNLCASRLHALDNAKEKWAQENNKTTNDTPTMADLNPYFRVEPRCPSGGTYTITPVGQLSTCSIPEHTEYYKTNTPAVK